MARANEREAVLQIQRFLRQLSYFDGEIPSVPTDGVFHTATEEAVRVFQGQVGLPATGRVDLATWEALFAAYTASLAQRQEPARLPLFPKIPENYTVGEGDAQLLVRIIQYALQELSTVYDSIGEVPQSGTYDARTAAAVRVVQGVYGLPVTGRVDRATWNALAEAYDRHFASPYLRQ
jgi:peptidoglycan hydrolase-like protein with peptidoglycan-binding domain